MNDEKKELIVGNFYKYKDEAYKVEASGLQAILEYKPHDSYKNSAALYDFKNVCMGAIQYRLNSNDTKLQSAVPLIWNLDHKAAYIKDAENKAVKVSITDAVLHDTLSKFNYKNQEEAEEAINLFVCATGSLLTREVKDFEKYKDNEYLYRALVKTSQLQFSQLKENYPDHGKMLSNFLNTCPDYRDPNNFEGRLSIPNIKEVTKSLDKLEKVLSEQDDKRQVQEIKNRVKGLYENEQILSETIKLLENDVKELNTKLEKHKNSIATKEDVVDFFKKAANFLGMDEEVAIKRASKLSEALKLSSTNEIKSLKDKVLEGQLANKGSSRSL